jgi:drug/metabolite transporter (DMT)-like permease
VIAARTVWTGLGLVIVYTALISSADGITKLMGAGYAAPQLYCLSGLIVVGLCLLSDRLGPQRLGLGTTRPRAMALRAGATVLAAVSFYYAFANLPFADVFVFIGLMPLIAGLLSGAILGETVRPVAWLALCAGFIGVVCLFPAGVGSVTIGHGFALSAAVFGTFSMVLARYIGRFETNALAQVFYPNLALFAIMALCLPFVWRPMPPGDLGWVVAYAVFLFAARWVLVVALRLLAAYAVTPLMNLQFVWMVVIGAVFFGEIPDAGTFLGVSIVIGSGLVLIWDQFAPEDSRIAFGRKPLAPRTDP